MAQVIVRNLADEVLDAHRRRAKARRVSLEQELRELLTRAAAPSREEILTELGEIRALQRPGRWPAAEEIVREARDRR